MISNTFHSITINNIAILFFLDPLHQLVGNKVNGRISKRMLQENTARQKRDCVRIKG